MSLYIGALSGTSMDGIDAAIVNLDDHSLIAADTTPYSDELKQFLINVTNGELVSVSDIARAHRLAGIAFSQACINLCNKAGISRSKISAIGSHGQTVCHDGSAEPSYTMQLGCAHTIAYNTGIKTVSDFRGRDIAAGGQGAPLAPLYHKVLFAKHPKPMLVVNIGGVANISCLNDKLAYGYDTGPGNGLMDAWMQLHNNAAFDFDGEWAASGTLIPELLYSMLKDEYFAKSRPKSLDKNYFSMQWLKQYLTKDMSPRDIQTTLTHFTAKTIADEVLKQSNSPSIVVCCGGGARNTYLLQCISTYLPKICVKTINQANSSLNGDYVEAMLFAWLAKQRIENRRIDSINITGSASSELMGVVYG